MFLLKTLGGRLGRRGGHSDAAATPPLAPEAEAERMEALRALTVLVPLLGQYIGNHAPQARKATSWFLLLFLSGQFPVSANRLDTLGAGAFGACVHCCTYEFGPL